MKERIRILRMKLGTMVLRGLNKLLYRIYLRRDRNGKI